MSGDDVVKGLEQARARLRGLDAEVASELEIVLGVEMPKLQKSIVELIAVRKGNLRDLLSSPEAMQAEADRFGYFTTWRFGFVTPQLCRDGWYAFFVEFGTRAYKAGSRRFNGWKKGKRTFRKVRRNVPARPAQSFMRVGFERWLPEFRQWRAMGAAQAEKRYKAGSGSRWFWQ